MNFTGLMLTFSAVLAVLALAQVPRESAAAESAPGGASAPGVDTAANARAAAWLDAIPAIAGDSRIYRTFGERVLRLNIYRPPAASSEKATETSGTKGPVATAPAATRPGVTGRPAILFIHGGGWGAGKPALFEPHARYFASRGLVAVTVEYRLTSEPGVTVFDCVADTKGAVRWVRAHAEELGVDPNRVAVAGDSAGGHLAASLNLIPGLEAPGEDLKIPSRPDAAILYNPIVDLLPPEGWDLAKRNGESGKLIAGRAREISPIHHIRREDPPAPPMLLIHGRADTVTPIANSDRFAQLLRERGDAPDYNRLNGQNHAFILRGYGPEAVVAAGLFATDRFLQGLGWLRGPSPLEGAEPTLKALSQP